jgi:hypothetical protein
LTLLVLYLLALLDGILCGLRTSMGRCPLIRKRSYYTHALFRGLLGAQVVSMIGLASLLLISGVTLRRDTLRADLESAAGRMLLVFLPYAALVLVSLALRLIPSTDVRSATSVLMLGPLTALRPLVMIVGVVYGISAGHLLETRLLGSFILALMLSLEFVLNRRAGRAQSIQIRQLI